ncbi:MAG TPA: 3-oxoacyl-[acyl-carrier-protein] synthase III C-terminal domain-containing protein [Stellaceae bacterium]|nr:3-oxoacyl-[acyl-carrier-protein] synthase III C-terminal domain-containing protein [Stellaceae bacterium]
MSPARAPSAPNLLGIATAVPAMSLAQEEIAAQAEALFGAAPEFERLRPVFANSGIGRRHGAVPLDWYERPRGWADRNERYLAVALDLVERAAGRVLDETGTAADDIGAIVAVSTTGIATPSLDARLMERMRLPRTVQRLPIFGLGCAGGAIGLARAATLAAATPDKAVLLVVVELCSLWFRRRDLSKGNIVGTALFADGAAAAVLRCGGEGPAVIAAGEHTWPDTLDVMGWEVADDGLKAVFSRDIPKLVTAELGRAARAFLAGHGLRPSDIDRFVCHPGGPKVIAACEAAFGLGPGALVEARAVLRAFGNMSAASVLFVLVRVLDKARRNREEWRHALVTALGPGFTAGFAVLTRE